MDEEENEKHTKLQHNVPFIPRFVLSAILQDGEDAAETGNGWEEWTQGKAPVRAADQLELTETVREGWRCSLLRFKTTIWAELIKLAQTLMLFCIIQCLYLNCWL